MNELEKINKQIAECLSGSGNYDDLKRLQSEKAEILDKAYFDSVSSLKAEIRALESQRVADFRAEETLQSQLEAAAMVVDEKAAILQQAREKHGELNGLIFLKSIAIDSNRQAINEKKAELNSLIESKINEVNQ